MMKYEIIVQEIIDPTEDNKYPSSVVLYKQEVEEIDLWAIIEAVNQRHPGIKK